MLRLLAGGMSVGGIAEELSLSARTVSTYRARLLEKMEMDPTAPLVRYALERNLIP